MAVADGMELANSRLVWSTSAPGASPAARLESPFNLTLWGTFTGLAATLQRSFDGGTTWHDCTQGAAPVPLSGPVSEICDEIEPGTLYRLNVTAIGSGTVNARLSR